MSNGWRLVAAACLVFGLAALLSCDLLGRLTGRGLPELQRSNPVDPEAAGNLGTGIQPWDGAATTDTTPVVLWQPFEGVASYEIQVSTSEDFAAPLVEQAAGIEDTHYQLSSVLQNNQQYFWRLRPSYTDGTNAGWSQAWKFTVRLPVPSLTTPAAGGSVGTPLPLLCWQTLAEAAQYGVQVCEAQDFSVLVAEAEMIAGNQYKLATLLADGSQYYWRVRITDANAVAGDWCEPSVFSVQFPKPGSPSPPTDSYVSDKTPSLQWGPVPDAAGYQIQLNDSNDFSGSQLFDEDDLTSPAYTLPSALAIHKQHFWRVRARYTSEIMGAWGDTWTFEHDGTIWKLNLQNRTSIPPAIAADGTIYVCTSSTLIAITSGGAKKWEKYLYAGELGSPAVDADGTVYVPNPRFLHALNPDGTQKWTYELSNSHSRRISFNSDGAIYTIAANRNLIALDPAGAVLWQFPTSNSILDLAIDAAGGIYFTESDKLHALDPAGIPNWVQSIGSCSSKAGFAVDSLGVYVPGVRGKLSALNPDGSKRWEFLAPSSEYENSPIVAAGGKVFIGLLNTLLAINADGTEQWRMDREGPSDSRVSEAVVGLDGTVYAGIYSNNGTGRLVAIGADGSRYWQVNRGQFGFFTIVMASDGTLYACCDEDLYAIETFSPGPAASGWPMYRHDAQRSGRAGP